jgi:secreted PhoX family phosphatase
MLGGTGNGGVGAITFNKKGRVSTIVILAKTTWNCGGGRTPWGPGLAEEQPGDYFQVDPCNSKSLKT